MTDHGFSCFYVTSYSPEYYTFQSFWYPPSREKETTSKARFKKKREMPVTSAHMGPRHSETRKKNQLFTQFMPRSESQPNAQQKAVVARAAYGSVAGDMRGRHSKRLEYRFSFIIFKSKMRDTVNSLEL